MATNTTDNLDNQPSDWASVPLIATTDRVRGGLDGAANKQAIALTKRVNYLKEQSELNPGNVIEATPKWADVPALNNVNINAQVKVLAERDEYILEQLQGSNNNGGTPGQALVSQVEALDSQVQALDSQAQALESQVNNLIEDLEQDGVTSLVPSPEWDSVPKLKGETKNVQAQALLNRTELLKDRVDRAVLYFSDYLTAFAAAATLPDGQGIMVEDVKEYYKVQGGNLVLIEFSDSHALTDFDGVVEAEAQWSEVPAHKNVQLDVQTQALADRDAFLKNSIKPAYPSSLYHKKVEVMLEYRGDGYVSAWAARGYTSLASQGMTIDEDANEIYVWMKSTTSNLVLIYDLQTGNYKKGFIPKTKSGLLGNVSTSSIVIRSIAGKKYAFVRLRHNYLSKIEIPTSFTDGAVLVADIDYNFEFTHSFCFDGVNWWFTNAEGKEFNIIGEYNINILTRRNDNFEITGFVDVGTDTVGLFGGGGDGQYWAPKTQGIFARNGYFYFPIGGYVADVPEDYRYQGVKIITSNGHLLASALTKYTGTRVSLRDDLGVSNASMYEPQGIYCTKDNKILSLINARSNSQFGIPLMVVVHENALEQDSVDWRNIAAYPVFQDPVVRQGGMHPRSPDGNLRNPATGAVFSSWRDIVKYMRRVGRTYFSYYSGVTNPVKYWDEITDGDGSCFVQIWLCSDTRLFVRESNQTKDNFYFVHQGNNTQTLVNHPVYGHWTPDTDNAYSVGTASRRATEVFAANGAINTSDEREKQQWRDQSDAEKAAALEIKSCIRAFKWTDAVDGKGESARWHWGVGAQTVGDILRKHGIEPATQAYWCYDEWDEHLEIKDEDGSVIQEYRPAGNRYGIRYNELAMFILAAL